MRQISLADSGEPRRQQAVFFPDSGELPPPSAPVAASASKPSFSPAAIRRSTTALG